MLQFRWEVVKLSDGKWSIRKNGKEEFILGDRQPESGESPQNFVPQFTSEQALQIERMLNRIAVQEEED